MKLALTALFLFVFITGGTAHSETGDDGQKALIELADLLAPSVQRHYELQGEEATIESAKNVVRDEFKDPDSALFRNVRLIDYKDGKIVCGEVNAKNSFGGYVGYQQFIASSSAAVLLKTATTRPPSMTNALSSICGR